MLSVTRILLLVLSCVGLYMNAGAGGKLPRWAQESVRKNPDAVHELRCNTAADFALRHHPLAKFVRTAIR